MSTNIIQANIDVHSRMADVYNNEPHFRPENQAKVRRRLEKLRANAPGGKMLDLGCGTGFILHLAVDLFDELHGVDVTRAMLDKVNLSSGKITLHNQPVELLPFGDSTFDAVTAYSFIHHVEDYGRVLAEAHRVMKPGAIFYIDLEPNRLFWAQMEPLRDATLPPMVARARDSVLFTDAKVEQDFGIPQDVFAHAEYGKSILGGIDPQQFEEIAATVGFSSCSTFFEWYVGQAEVMHGQSFEAAARIEQYLHNIAPLSHGLFKYLRFLLVK